LDCGNYFGISSSSIAIVFEKALVLLLSLFHQTARIFAVHPQLFNSECRPNTSALTKYLHDPTRRPFHHSILYGSAAIQQHVKKKKKKKKDNPRLKVEGRR
jgi:hypothetical protein